MIVSVKGNEQVTKMLNEWYIEIRARHVGKAHNLKLEIDQKIHNIEEDQNLLLYYALLDFRYQYMLDSLSIGKDSFDKVDSLGVPTDQFLQYYYHFFKAIHSNITGDFTCAKEHYNQAELLLKHIPDEIEHAEFHFKLSTFHYHIYKPLAAIKEATKAKDIFKKHAGYETNIGLCDNLIGLACTHLKQFEEAEEHFITAINTFKKSGEEKNITFVRHNLGLMYSGQNLSELAIRYLSEVTQELPKDYKAIFIKAREHMKICESKETSNLIVKGLEICKELKNEEYEHHFLILGKLNQKVSADELEKTIKTGISYFERENLHEYVQEYAKKLAVLFHQENNRSKASDYFYLSHQAEEQNFEKEALK
ncbi:tetratricopeptide repeat protein [Bacillus cereus]|uniref:Tetratricopeptide repeat protein n=2 Tax=Bacillus cereus group TaxID=86661 RepID=A0A9W7PZM7_BACCE|nr:MULTISPECIES: Rap family tetratricopeptide repeat protein [Bacillus cereus group]KAA6452215.1 tetratricopeptide repeat protein [Bacillus cereus]KAB2423645.1 tetratricopeptide repeat protein [Bacillus cereus]KAB2439858.1 tetratricopeptide repeat protein [Bacillus luti]KAB2458487.1 tetratricopeptide repeat protein [Bacillus cereus]KAB2477973.1 tetratricopeptide repeat protein [Bacillus cereus]